MVYRREVELLCAAADELARGERPDVALEEWMQRFVGYIATKRGMANSLRLLLATKSQLFAKASGMDPQAMHRLVEAAAILARPGGIGPADLSPGAGNLQIRIVVQTRTLLRV